MGASRQGKSAKGLEIEDATKGSRRKELRPRRKEFLVANPQLIRRVRQGNGSSAFDALVESFLTWQ